MVGEGQEGVLGAGDPAVSPQVQTRATELWDSPGPVHRTGLQVQVLRARGYGSARHVGAFFLHPRAPGFLLGRLDDF